MLNHWSQQKEPFNFNLTKNEGKTFALHITICKLKSQQGHINRDPLFLCFVLIISIIDLT